jgi:hypothetical protein
MTENSQTTIEVRPSAALLERIGARDVARSHVHDTERALRVGKILALEAQEELAAVGCAEEHARKAHAGTLRNWITSGGQGTAPKSVGEDLRRRRYDAESAAAVTSTTLADLEALHAQAERDTQTAQAAIEAEADSILVSAAELLVNRLNEAKALVADLQCRFDAYVKVGCRLPSNAPRSAMDTPIHLLGIAPPPPPPMDAYAGTWRAYRTALINTSSERDQAA